MIEINKSDPHRFRHYREQAIGHYVAGRLGRAVEIAQYLTQQAPDLARNRLVFAVFLQLSGETEKARAQFVQLGGLDGFRKTQIGDRSVSDRFEAALAQLCIAK